MVATSSFEDDEDRVDWLAIAAVGYDSLQVQGMVRFTGAIYSKHHPQFQTSPSILRHLSPEAAGLGLW
jgi:hypothetical protein